MDAPHSARLADAFVRRLIEDGLQVESCCKYCGAVIIGSVMRGLANEELRHLQNCSKVPEK
jgi:hypothetical protein